MRYAVLLILTLLAFNSQAQSIEVDDQGFETFDYVDGDTTWTMKKYFFCILKQGENRDHTDQERQEIQAGHLANLKRLGEEKIICIAGPLGEHPEYRGIVIFSTPTIEDARKHMETDPAVIAGRLDYEMIEWWAAKGTKLF